MSGPYVYTTPMYSPSPYVAPFLTHAPTSPFIPPRNLAPDTPRRVRFDDYDLPPPLVSRPRAGSWHAPAPPVLVTPHQQPKPLQYVVLPPAPQHPGYLTPVAAPMGHHRSRSFNGTGAAPMYGQPWYLCTPTMQQVMQPVSPPLQVTPLPVQQPLPMQFVPQIHPYLDGSAPRPDFVFDLSAPKFAPAVMRPDGKMMPVPETELAAPATHPPVFKMRIHCDMAPQWPIELAIQRSPRSVLLQVPSPGGNPMVPITLGDVLQSLYAHLRHQVTHLDWGRLSYSEETAIARAYTRRCRASGNGNVLGEQAEASQGVKRIDYLMDRFMFRGLVRASASDGFENMKLMVGSR